MTELIKGDDETVRVGDIPSRGDCHFCKRPIRYFVHSTAVWWDHGTKYEAHRPCFEKDLNNKPKPL